MIRCPHCGKAIFFKGAARNPVKVAKVEYLPKPKEGEFEDRENRIPIVYIVYVEDWYGQKN